MIDEKTGWYFVHASIKAVVIEKAMCCCAAILEMNGNSLAAGPTGTTAHSPTP